MIKSIKHHSTSFHNDSSEFLKVTEFNPNESRGFSISPEKQSQSSLKSSPLKSNLKLKEQLLAMKPSAQKNHIQIN